MLLTICYFFLALLLLVIIHETGHFLVARWCGVKVLRFSFGIGKVLAIWRDKRGTEFAFSALPIGGYVKMLDESEGPVSAAERHLTFNAQPVWRQLAIVLAGPLFNFLFAFVALWLVLVIGVKSLAPLIENVKPHSIAAHAGFQPRQEIVAVEDSMVTSWRDFQYAMLSHLGTNDTVRITVLNRPTNQKISLALSLNQWQLDPKQPDMLQSLGIVPFVPVVPAIIGEVLPNSPAQIARLKVGDKIIAVDKKKINDWMALVDLVKANPGRTMIFTYSRDGLIRTSPVHIGSQTEQGPAKGFVGLRSQSITLPPNWLRLQRANPIKALGIALEQTVDLTEASFMLVGRLVTGHLPIQSISGPLGIAQGAGESARSGFVYYLSFLALVSISLGVLNLLPIPMLDGGYLLYYLLECIKRRPLSERFKSATMFFGLGLLIVLTILAVSNDLSRLS